MRRSAARSPETTPGKSAARDEWRTVVVLSGTIYFGLGDTWDEGKLKPYPTGTFLSEPKDTPHFVWAKDGEVIVQVTAMGPTATKMIPPK